MRCEVPRREREKRERGGSLPLSVAVSWMIANAVRWLQLHDAPRVPSSSSDRASVVSQPSVDHVFVSGSYLWWIIVTKKIGCEISKRNDEEWRDFTARIIFTIVQNPFNSPTLLSVYAFQTTLGVGWRGTTQSLTLQFLRIVKFSDSIPRACPLFTLLTQAATVPFLCLFLCSVCCLFVLLLSCVF